MKIICLSVLTTAFQAMLITISIDQYEGVNSFIIQGKRVNGSSILSDLTSGKSPRVATLEHLTATRKSEDGQNLDENKPNKKKSKKKNNEMSKADKISQSRSDSRSVDNSNLNETTVRMVTAEVQLESVAVVVEKDDKEEVYETDNSSSKRSMKSISSRFVYDNDLILAEDEGGITARPKTSISSTNFAKKSKINTKTTKTASSNKYKSIAKFLKEEVPKPVVPGSFNVVLTHCTADFDTLASAVGLAKLWSTQGHNNENTDRVISSEFQSSQNLPTFVVLPRGAHPAVQKFLSLHKHLFPIRSLKSLPNDLSGLNRLGLVDAQRRDRVGPAEHLISHAKRVTIVDHHIDGESDILEATDYVVEKVGSVSTMIAERLRGAGLELTEAEATLLALGIHADTGSLVFDSTTPRDAEALAWVMAQGASQAAIAEHVHSTLSQEQQGVLTNALINTNSTIIHGVTISTVLLSADGFINGLAAVTQDALELSSSDVFLLAVVYDPKSGGRGKGKGGGGQESGIRLQSKLFTTSEDKNDQSDGMMTADAWKGGEKAFKLKRLRTAFDKKDTDGSGYLEANEISNALAQSGIISTDEAFQNLMTSIDTDGDGRIDFDEFVNFSEKIAEMQAIEKSRKPSTMIVM
jgi:nanoRNase/pAp phosphatase (c-di-AMP/oligoRNAs hydrolase)